MVRAPHFVQRNTRTLFFSVVVSIHGWILLEFFGHGEFDFTKACVRPSVDSPGFCSFQARSSRLRQDGGGGHGTPSLRNEVASYPPFALFAASISCGEAAGFGGVHSVLMRVCFFLFLLFMCWKG